MKKTALALALSLLTLATAAGAQPDRVTVLGTEQDRQVAQLKYRVAELERKLEGVQKQVTVLHAKSAEGKDIQTAVTVALSRRIYALEHDVERLQKASVLTHQAVNKLRK